MQLTQQKTAQRFGDQPPTVVGAEKQHAPATLRGGFDVQDSSMDQLRDQLRSGNWAVSPACTPTFEQRIHLQALIGVLFKARVPPPHGSTQHSAGFRVLLSLPEDGMRNTFYAFADIRASAWMQFAMAWRSTRQHQHNRQPVTLLEVQQQQAHLQWELAVVAAGGVSQLAHNTAMMHSRAASWAHLMYTQLLTLIRVELRADAIKTERQADPNASVPGPLPWLEWDDALCMEVLRQSGLLQQQHDAWGANL